MRKPICLENKCYFNLQTRKISKWSLNSKEVLIQLNINCHGHRCYYSLLYINYNFSLWFSPLQAKGMIPNEMLDGKKFLSHSGNQIQKFWGLCSIGYCYIWPRLFKYGTGCKTHLNNLLKSCLFYYIISILVIIFKNSPVVLLLIYHDFHITIYFIHFPRHTCWNIHWVKLWVISYYLPFDIK